ncbi:MAG: DivIVA domain-containing protein [Myxococcota bacterium]
MRMTPLDVQSHAFARRFRGYDPDEVDAFLRIVSEDYETLVRENASQTDRLWRLERRIEELSAQEQLLKQTLISAQAMCDELRRTAERDAELRLAEVEVRAEKILDASHRRAAQLAQDIREMRALRTRLAESMRSAAETHLALLATLEADPAEDPLVKGLSEGTVAYLKADRRRPSPNESGASAGPSPAPEALPGLPPAPPSRASGDAAPAFAEPGKDSRRV